MYCATHGYDVLIIGGGLAGLSVALNLPAHMRIAVVSKATLDMTASGKAQGGIAAVLDPQDHTDNHIRDTLVAGAGLCDIAATSHIVQAAPAAINWLQRYAVAFTCATTGQLHLTREAGHSHRRIVHAADSTGLAVTSVLQAQLRQKPNVDLYEHTLCVDAIISRDDNRQSTCHGIRAINIASGQWLNLAAGTTVLATGGLGQLFPYTTNPETATGDGVALGWRAGCRISNLEFIQFHPTALALAGVPTFLISEAVRGEGGVLRNQAGHRFMPDYDTRAELAPRDIVARAIHAETGRQQGKPVWLDISHRGAGFVKTHFPTIYQTCLDHGLDISHEPIPVAPAAHYSCGGITTDLSGCTNIAGLYAVGEVADTGLHGANRLASNSLLECIVLGSNCAKAIIAQAGQADNRSRQTTQTTGKAPVQNRHPSSAESYPSPDLTQVRQLMGNHLGIVRTTTGIRQALTQLNLWRGQFERVSEHAWTPAMLTLRNHLDCAWLIASCAAQRLESRGLHTLTDYPDTSRQARCSVVRGKATDMDGVTNDHAQVSFSASPAQARQLPAPAE